MLLGDGAPMRVVPTAAGPDDPKRALVGAAHTSSMLCISHPGKCRPNKGQSRLASARHTTWAGSAVMLWQLTLANTLTKEHSDLFCTAAVVCCMAQHGIARYGTNKAQNREGKQEENGLSQGCNSSGQSTCCLIGALVHLWLLVVWLWLQVLTAAGRVIFPA